ncbi:hypothetical protein DPMN_042826 [Dreissena polymorpha]|uniref:Uncharacterized protein n=1 Tax=Dreissena polymorpha TaxID=45954 RepID=A0A9D4D2R8_DREPO|nr:hypothetical protein DPMN_042826 [Dreissena polymorpha]
MKGPLKRSKNRWHVYDIEGRDNTRTLETTTANQMPRGLASQRHYKIHACFIIVLKWIPRTHKIPTSVVTKCPCEEADQTTEHNDQNARTTNH